VILLGPTWTTLKYMTAHQKIGEDRTCSSGDMIADRQTHTQTERHAHHNTPLPYRGRSINSGIVHSQERPQDFG